MRVKIGIKHTNSEIEFESTQSTEELINQLASNATEATQLQDGEGRTLYIPAGSVAFADFQDVPTRRVGFGV